MNCPVIGLLLAMLDCDWSIDSYAWLWLVNYLHLNIEVPLFVLFLHLKVECYVLMLEQTWSPEWVSILVIQSSSVLNLFLFYN